ncbi:MAG: glutathione synthase [Desulfosarcina sp.]|nr:glutathione synthase [Desulfosarcina sp.]MBC2764707.1 glutathione synthase [Desulfosarcina sp.]
MKIAYLMDPLESIQPENETTSYLMYECNERGHTVYFLEPHDVYIRNGQVVARMRNITVQPGLEMTDYWMEIIQCTKQDDLIFEAITELDALFLRSNPPLNYQTIEFLQPVDNHVFILNSTTGQIIGNSKLYSLNFPDIIPETHVSRDPSRLRKIIDDFGGAMVVKPLQGFGGEGVIKVSNRDRENLNSLIHYYVRAYEPYPRREPIMVQEYLKSVKQDGDIRILLLNGEIIGAMCRRPKEGDFRTNVHAGGEVFAHQPSRQEQEICRAIKEKLIEDGLYFVGIDIIGGKLVEINCVSPGGIPRINRLNNDHLEAKVVDFIEEEVKGITETNHRERSVQ